MRRETTAHRATRPAGGVASSHTGTARLRPSGSRRRRISRAVSVGRTPPGTRGWTGTTRVSPRELREPPLQLTKHIRRQIPESLMLKRGQLLSSLVALFVEIVSRRKGRGDVGARRPPGRRHGLLSSEQFIVYIRTELVELSGRQSEQLIPRFIRLAAFLPIRRMQKPLQCHIMLTQHFFHLLIPSTPLLPARVRVRVCI